MGKRRESVGRCLESESVGSLGQEERREGLRKMPDVQMSVSTMTGTALLKVLCQILPQTSCRTSKSEGLPVM